MNERDDIIYGKNPVMEAIKAGREINKLFLETGMRDNIFNAARKKGIIVINVDRRKLDKMTGGYEHQGVVAFVSPYKYHEIEDILGKAKDAGEDPFILLLDGLTDDNNLANMIRSAYAFGAHGIVIPKRNSVTLNSIVAKRSAGAVEYMMIARVTNMARTIDELKELGIWIYCADTKGETELSEASFSGPVALVIGSEGYGAGRLIKDKSDFTISIPLKGEADSLNAANAAAVILYEISKQRRKREIERHDI